jgi:hypothetical protein
LSTIHRDTVIDLAYGGGSGVSSYESSEIGGIETLGFEQGKERVVIRSRSEGRGHDTSRGRGSGRAVSTSNDGRDSGTTWARNDSMVSCEVDKIGGTDLSTKVGVERSEEAVIILEAVVLWAFNFTGDEEK